MMYFISDTHFNHSGSLKWTNCAVKREFSTIKEMNETMITNWNSVVSQEDEVYFIGDFAYKCNRNLAENIFWQLNGKKHLIKGNHDYKIASEFKECWESISDIKQIDFINDKGCKQEIILCHYPMLSWRHKEQGSWHLHGHVHGSLQEINKGTKRYDCSVEVNNYTPVSLNLIKQKLT
jgi:calcineurin-like phosphoesterase family protein